jgi:hypothetical protein
MFGFTMKVFEPKSFTTVVWCNSTFSSSNGSYWCTVDLGDTNSKFFPIFLLATNSKFKRTKD